MGPFFWLGHALGIARLGGPAAVVGPGARGRLPRNPAACSSGSGSGRSGRGSRRGLRLRAGASNAHRARRDQLRDLAHGRARRGSCSRSSPVQARTRARRRAEVGRRGILLLGAVNAAASLAVAGPARCGGSSPVGAGSAGCSSGGWLVAVVMATAWWIGPLVLLGRYSPPFLDWIEDARVTTAVASVTEALRGTTQWIATIGGQDNALWPAGGGGAVDVPERHPLRGGRRPRRPHGPRPGPGTVDDLRPGGSPVGLSSSPSGTSVASQAPGRGPRPTSWTASSPRSGTPTSSSRCVRCRSLLGVAHGLPLAVAWLRAPAGALAAGSRPAARRPGAHRPDGRPGPVGAVQRDPSWPFRAPGRGRGPWLDDHPDPVGRTLLLPEATPPPGCGGNRRTSPSRRIADPAVDRAGRRASRVRGRDPVLEQSRPAWPRAEGDRNSFRSWTRCRDPRPPRRRPPASASSRTTPPGDRPGRVLVASGARSVASFGDIVGGSTDLATDVRLGPGPAGARARSCFEVGTHTRRSPPPTRTRVSEVVRYAGGPEGTASLPVVGDSIFTAGARPAGGCGRPRGHDRLPATAPVELRRLHGPLRPPAGGRAGLPVPPGRPRLLARPLDRGLPGPDRPADRARRRR